jgi:hypothetical protein
MGDNGPYLPPDPTSALLGSGPSVEVRTDDNGGFLRQPGSSGQARALGTAQTATQDGGGSADWDITSLGVAQDWLRTHPEFLVRVRQRMTEIDDLLAGPASSSGPTTSALGAFEKATELKTKHDGIYDGVRKGLETVIEDLLDSVDALGRVIERYENAEQRNALTAAQWQSIFGEGAGSKHDILPDANPDS